MKLKSKFLEIGQCHMQTGDKGQQEKYRISCRCRDKEKEERQKLSAKKIMAKQCPEIFEADYS